MLPWFIVAVSWAAWAYPFLFLAPHRQNRPSITVIGPTRIGLLLEVGAIFMAFLSRNLTVYPPNTIELAGASICGLLAAILGWTSVRHLGRQFRIHAGLYEDHELVRSGPYAIVRHPIYASLLAILLCTILALSPWRWALASIVLFIAGTEIRVHSEDGLLESRFGEQFREYQRRVPAYLPLVR